MWRADALQRSESPECGQMLEVTQTRTIQWEREVSELSDSEMVEIAREALAAPLAWTGIETDEFRTVTVSLQSRRVWLMCVCIEAEDDLLLEILHVRLL